MNVLLADDHQIFREGLRRILEDNRFAVVAEASNGLEAVERAVATRPDVVVMDVGMPIMNGIEATAQVVRRGAGRVVVLSIYDDESAVIRAFRAGASAYVHKRAAGRELMDALDACSRGEIFLSRMLPEAVRRRVLDSVRGGERFPGDALSSLTRRQRQVLQMVAEGLTSKEIAKILRINLETVKSHRKALMRKLDIHSVAGLTQFAIETGLIRRPGSASDPSPEPDPPEPEYPYTPGTDDPPSDG